MIKFLILTGLFISLKAFAGYKCDFSLANSEDFRATIVSKTVIASEKDMRSLSIKDFYRESTKGARTTSVALNIFIDGWAGEEEVTVAAMRRVEKKSNVELSLISEKVSLRGNAQDTLWFDNYKLDIKCSLI